MFVRKRDPRYKAHIARQARSPAPTPATASGTTTPKRTAPKSTFVAQDWQKVVEPGEALADLEWALAEGTEDEEWECIACNKAFKSEAAWNSHERSKKHLRTVEQLKREMRDEELELELGQDDGANAEVDHEEVDDEVRAVPIADDVEDGEPPEVSPDRVIPAPTPNEDEDPTEEFEDRPSRKTRTQESHTGSLIPPPAPSIPKASHKDAARRSTARHETDGDPEPPEENRETVNVEPRHDESHSDVGRDGDDAVAANSTKGEMSKREKRKAREAAKKAREGEAKNGCAVSSPHQILLPGLAGVCRVRYFWRWAVLSVMPCSFLGRCPLTTDNLL